VRAHEHALLFQAIAEGDADTAADVMRAHVRTSLGAKSAWRLSTPDAR
jgi:DNA-binding GntR family transcriptional regulator